jgi:hypothetical protein
VAIDLDAIKARRAAFPAENVRLELQQHRPYEFWVSTYGHATDDACRYDLYDRTDKETHEFIAHAPDDIDALLAEVERLKEYEWKYNDLCR